MFTQEYLKKKIKEKSKGSPGGTECVFIKINDRWAIKLYDSRSLRDSCYYWQKLAAENGLGPEVGGKFDLEDCEIKYSSFDDPEENYIPEYGYITEIVEVIADQGDYDNWGDWRSVVYSAEDTEEYQDEIENLCDKLEEIGFDTSDLFGGNVGYKNGRMICIDFGNQY